MPTPLTSPIDAYAVTELSERLAAAVLDTDLLYLFDPLASSGGFYKVARSSLLNGVLRSATSGSMTSLTLTTSLILGATFSNIAVATVSTIFPAIGASTEGTVTGALAGALTTDLIIAMPTVAMPTDMLIKSTRCTTDGTITYELYNANGAYAGGDTVPFLTAALRLA